MAGKKAGNGSMSDLTVEILKDIRAELRKQGGDLAGLRVEMRERLDTLTARIENIRDFAGERYRDHEERLRGLEQRIGRLDPPGR